MRINAIKNAAGAMRYFKSALATQDYYTKDEEVKGRWAGILAERMGIEGEVTHEQFERIVNNQNPATGEKLTPRNIKNRRIGYDFTFNAVKSVSIAYAITGDPEILKAHQMAVEEAMAEVERNMQTQAGQGKEKHYEQTGNLLYAAFDHFTSRPVEKHREEKTLISDPHLHTHAVVANCTFYQPKNRYQAIEVGVIKKEAAYYESIYHAAFVRGLKEAGYTINKTGNRYEIAGIGREIIEKFSGRTLEINQLAKDKNILDAKARNNLGARTRKDKSKGMREAELKSEWISRLSPQELHSIRNAKGKSEKTGKGKTEGGVLHPQIFDRISRFLDLSLDHHLERKSVASEKQIIARVINAGMGEYSHRQVKEVLDGREDILATIRGSSRLITTRAMVEAEKELLGFAVGSRGKFPALHAGYIIKNEILNKAQKEAVMHTLSSPDGVILLGGDAGTGKTTLLMEIRGGIESCGKSLFAFAPSADASRGVLRDKGFESATTIQELLKNQKLQEKTANQIILVDEAAMVSTRDMLAIFNIAKKQNSRVILAGDYKQHHSVEAGDAMRMLENKTSLPIKRVREVVRQNKNPELKNIVSLLAKGQHEKAFRALDKNGHILQIKDQDKRDQAIAQDYLKTIASGKTALLVCPTHNEGQRVTNRIREVLKDKGLIDAKEVKFETQKNLSLTRAEKQDARSFAPGMLVQFHKRIRGFRHGTSYEVVGLNDQGRVLIKAPRAKSPSPLPFEAHDSYQVYERTMTSIAKGDLLRINANGKTLEGKNINNGQVLKVNGFDRDGNIMTSPGRTVPKDYGNLGFGYFRTSHSSQGKDAQVLLLSQGSESFTASNQKQFYVSVSRGAEQVRIYTDDKKELAQAILKPDERMDAMDIAKEQVWKNDLRRRAYQEVQDRIHQQNTISHHANRQIKPDRNPQKQMENRGKDMER